MASKTLWNWLQLLIIPVVLASGSIWYNRTEKHRDEKVAKQTREYELALVDHPAEQ